MVIVFLFNKGRTDCHFQLQWVYITGLMLSILTVLGLLAMTLLGSVGTTHNEIAETLGFSQGNNITCVKFTHGTMFGSISTCEGVNFI